ncbi:Uncharacterised protein [Mycobacteroides abscessus subsp. abscessus]|nr:Uncharacterised protein [Mycobacteroides abscessus subsp. abscessus]
MHATRQIEHGTTKGYQQHIRWRVPTCDACRHANREYLRDYRLRTGRAYSTRITVAALAALLATAPPDIAAKVRDELGVDRYRFIREQAPV